ncbi:TetR family transcriptional regulator [Alcaligenes aquatilis]|nr:TetR family transcriptional regulator [Alcaligenes aquatilis]
MVEQAIELFAQKGFALTTRELARELRITQPLMYRYFPSKQDLIEQVYERVFLSRWNPLWEVWLADRSRPFRDRLVQYFSDYTQAILTSEWVRIFLYAGLQDPSLNQRYLQMLHERIFRILSQELQYDLGREQALTPRQAMLENEAWWGLHSSFFYMGVRKWVYQLEVPDELEAVIAYRVDAFLDGLR